MKILRCTNNVENPRLAGASHWRGPYIYIYIYRLDGNSPFSTGYVLPCFRYACNFCLLDPVQLDAPVSTPSADSTRGPRGYTILTFDTLSDGIYCAQRVGDRAIVNATIKDLELVACVCFFIYVFGLYAVGDVSVKYGNMDYLLSFFFQLINYSNVFGTLGHKHSSRLF